MKRKIRPLEALRLAISLVFVFAIRSTFADQYVVPTGSMVPTIVPGDHVFVNKMAYDLRVPFTDSLRLELGQPRRGEVVVFYPPHQPSTTFIKRVVGVPGDRVAVRDGELWINGSPCRTGSEPEVLGGIEHAVRRDPIGDPSLSEVRELIVPAGHYFMMGDNRDQSADSRVWGLVDREAIRGRAVRVIFPAWRGLGSASPQRTRC